MRRARRRSSRTRGTGSTSCGSTAGPLSPFTESSLIRLIRRSDASRCPRRLPVPLRDTHQIESQIRIPRKVRDLPTDHRALVVVATRCDGRSTVVHGEDLSLASHPGRDSRQRTANGGPKFRPKRNCGFRNAWRQREDDAVGTDTHRLASAFDANHNAIRFTRQGFDPDVQIDEARGQVPRETARQPSEPSVDTIGALHRGKARVPVYATVLVFSDNGTDRVLFEDVEPEPVHKCACAACSRPRAVAFRSTCFLRLRPFSI